MPVIVEPDAELPHTALYHFTAPWSWDHFLAAFEDELNIARAAQGARYDVIGDFLHSPGLPNGSGIAHVASIFRRYPPNWGMTVVVASSMLIGIMVSTFNKIYPRTAERFVLCPTLDEAREVIRARRAAALNSEPPTLP